jgi:hypothetical protein
VLPESASGKIARSAKAQRRSFLLVKSEKIVRKKEKMSHIHKNCSRSKSEIIMPRKLRAHQVENAYPNNGFVKSNADITLISPVAGTSPLRAGTAPGTAPSLR